MNLTPPLVYWSKHKHPHCKDIQVIICKKYIIIIIMIKKTDAFLFANTEFTSKIRL